MTTDEIEAAQRAGWQWLMAHLGLHDQRLDALARLNRDHTTELADHEHIIDREMVRSDDLESRIAALEARIAAPVAPESVVNVSEVSQEPGNATEAHSPDLADAAFEYVHGALMDIATALGVRTASDYLEGQDAPNWKLVARILTTAGEVAAALRVYRKVQACTTQYGSVWNGETWMSGGTFLAWLKEGEA